MIYAQCTTPFTPRLWDLALPICSTDRHCLCVSSLTADRDVRDKKTPTHSAARRRDGPDRNRMRILCSTAGTPVSDENVITHVGRVKSRCGRRAQWVTLTWRAFHEVNHANRRADDGLAR
jgi:hypothetical protein